jgi:hypothetical protein
MQATKAMSDIEFTLSLPLDSEGFLRRACPSCERDFKWRPTDPDDNVPDITPAYFCPYCGASAAPDQWLTSEQLAYIEGAVAERVIAPSLDGLDEALRKLERSAGGLIQATVEVPRSEQAPPIFEPDDMRAVEFRCHPDEPLKVVEAWVGELHCLICGQVSDASSP